LIVKPSYQFCEFGTWFVRGGRAAVAQTRLQRRLDALENASADGHGAPTNRVPNVHGAFAMQWLTATPRGRFVHMRRWTG